MIVNFLQSLMRYALPDNIKMAITKPFQIRAPAMPLWRIPENSVPVTNIGMLNAPARKTESKVNRLFLCVPTANCICFGKTLHHSYPIVSCTRTSYTGDVFLLKVFTGPLDRLCLL